MTTPLISVSDLKEFLPVRPGYSAEDAKLAGLILVASTMIEDFTRRNFARTTYVEYFGTAKAYSWDYNLLGDDASGVAQTSRTQLFSLAGYPIDTDEDIEVRYDPSAAFGDDTILDSTYYLIDAPNNRMILKYPTAKTYNGLKVSYTSGYTEENGSLSTTIPADLKQACIQQTIELWNRSNPANIGVTEDRAQGKVTGQSKFQVGGGITPTAQMLVTKYRRLLTGRS